MLLNARSVFKKIGELHATIDQLKPDFIFLTESWLNNDVTDAMIVPSNRYHIIRTDRVDKCGGGVCALVNKRFVVVPLEAALGVEIAAFDVILSDFKYRFIVCYRPPYYDTNAADYLNAFVACLELLCDVAFNIFIVGDFNMPDICWPDFSCLGRHINFCSKFLDFVCDEGLSQCVAEPTRDNNILDLVFTNDPLLVGECTVGPPFIGCDHLTVHFNVMLPAAAAAAAATPAISSSADSDILCYYNYSAGDYVGLNAYLAAVNWQEVFADNENDINKCWQSFATVLSQAIELFVPVKVFDPDVSKRDRKLLPLFIRQLYRKKNAAWRLYRQHRTDALRDKYKAACDKCRSVYIKYVISRENELIEKGNLGSFYRYVNSKLVFKSGIGVLKDNDGVFIYDDETKANLLNDFYSSVFITDNNVLPNFPSRVADDCELSDVRFTPDVIYKHLVKLKPKTGGGPDGLAAMFLKNAAGTLASPLAFLYSRSFDLSALPDVWKSAVVTPVFKKGAPSATSNYRPISLTCIVCKIMESVIKDNLIAYLLGNGLITKQQHGFLAKHSTCSQLLECVDDWSIELNLRHSIDVAYIDFQKAFDSVVHSKLCYKLKSYGVSGKLLEWVSDFLFNRVQAVKVNNKISGYVSVKSGVPQGSVLGPVLFLLYINDIVDLFGSDLTVKLFADDVKIYAVINDITDVGKFQAGLDALNVWSTAWQLPISLHKCAVLHLGRSNSSHSYTINNVCLPNVKITTDLGITVDSNLRFTKHYRITANKAHHRASLILKSFISREPTVLFKAFTVYVLPLLEYCSPVWAPVYKGDIELIERVQRRFTKRLRGLEELSYADRLLLLGEVETLELRRLKIDLIMIYKIINGLIALDFAQFFGLNNYNCTRGNDYKLLKPVCNNNVRQFSFACRRIDAWNSLPTAVVTAASVVRFKALLNTANLSKFLIIK